jgi:hypothetical protein
LKPWRHAASITGAFVAMSLAIGKLMEAKR